MATKKKISRKKAAAGRTQRAKPPEAKKAPPNPAPEPAGDLLEFDDGPAQKAIIKVVGVGGGGGNALDNMVISGLRGVDFIAANTDAQAMEHNRAPIKIQLGAEITRGLGCGADPEKGRAAALEVRERLREVFLSTDMVFVTAGLGGGTGTGAAPIVAEVARECGALTVGVVTKPFLFEGKVRTQHAERGLEELHRMVDTVITIPNQRLLTVAGKNTAMKDAFNLADDVLLSAVRGISDLITVHGLINLDFADVRTIMNNMGVALMGTGAAEGENRAEEAARMAISSPLLEDLSIEGARGVLINITGASDLTLFEVNEASTLIQEAAHEDANIIFGAVIDDSLKHGEMRVTVIATGLDDAHVGRERRKPSSSEDPLNVMPLHPRPTHERIAAPLAGSATGSDTVPSTPPAADGAAVRDAEHDTPSSAFVSPFEDELDVPTFLRRSAD